MGQRGSIQGKRTDNTIRIPNQDIKLGLSVLDSLIIQPYTKQVEFDDLLARGANLNRRLQSIFDESTELWGIKVTAVAIREYGDEANKLQ